MKMLRSESGASRLKAIFWLGVVVLFFYTGIKIVPVYWEHESMKDTMRTKAGVAQVLKDEEILRDLVQKANELNLPLKAENFIIERDMERRKMRIRTAWEVEVHFLGDLYVHVFRFSPSVEENIMSL